MDEKPQQRPELRVELRVVLLGKTGVGKSASGNSLVGSERFPADVSSASVTTKCKQEATALEGQALVVVDTPGLFHTGRSHGQVSAELLECVAWLSPGPHVILLAMKLGVFSRQDKETLEAFQEVFSNAADHTVVLFTHAALGCDVDAFIRSRERLKTFIAESCAAYHAIDNEARPESQLSGLRQKILAVVRRNRRRHYSNDMFQRAAIALQEVMQRPEVTPSGREEALVHLQAWIRQGLTAATEQLPGLRRFLQKVEEVSYRCIVAQNATSERR